MSSIHEAAPKSTVPVCKQGLNEWSQAWMKEPRKIQASSFAEWSADTCCSLGIFNIWTWTWTQLMFLSNYLLLGYCKITRGKFIDFISPKMQHGMFNKKHSFLLKFLQFCPKFQQSFIPCAFSKFCLNFAQGCLTYLSNFAQILRENATRLCFAKFLPKSATRLL